MGDVLQIQARVDLNILFRHRLRLFDMVIIPMMNDASGTWTLSKEHERMIQSTQRKMLRSSIQTRRTYTKKTQNNEVKVEEELENGKQRKMEEKKKKITEAMKMKTDGNSSNTNCDQDSDISYMNDTDEEIGTADIEDEDWLNTSREVQMKPWNG